MSCIVYQTDRNGNKYAYESTSYWDKEKNQPRSRRKYIGKVDPETGEIIPSKKTRTLVRSGECVAQPPLSSDDALLRLYDEIRRKDEQIRSLRNEKKQLEDRCSKMAEIFRKISSIAGDAADV